MGGAQHEPNLSLWGRSLRRAMQPRMERWPHSLSHVVKTHWAPALTLSVCLDLEKRESKGSLWELSDGGMRGAGCPRAFPCTPGISWAHRSISSMRAGPKADQGKPEWLPSTFCELTLELCIAWAHVALCSDQVEYSGLRWSSLWPQMEHDLLTLSLAIYKKERFYCGEEIVKIPSPAK